MVAEWAGIIRAFRMIWAFGSIKAFSAIVKGDDRWIIHVRACTESSARNISFLHATILLSYVLGS